jgi:hypothetical protein
MNSENVNDTAIDICEKRDHRYRVIHRDDEAVYPADGKILDPMRMGFNACLRSL